MSVIGTSCKDCVFNVNENGQQTSCQLGLLDTIKIKSSQCEIVGGDYEFDRVCNFKSTDEKTKEEILKEKYTRFNFIIIDENLDKTLSILDTIKNLVTENNTVVVTTVENSDVLISKLKHKKNYVVTHYFEDNTDVFYRMDDAIPKLKNGYTIVLNEHDEISRKDLDKINEFVNIKMNKLALVENSPFVINSVIYKMLKGNKGLSFKDKLVELQQEQEIDSMIFTWEDINEDTGL